MTRLKWALPTIVLLLLLTTLAFAQSADGSAIIPDAPVASARSIEDLNLVGADVFMPPIADSVISVNSPSRSELASHGMALRAITGLQYTQNTLAAPVAADDQVYVGQRPYEGTMLQGIFTADLRQLHLRRAQLNISGVWNWVSWDQAYPKTIQMSNLYLYKEFGEDRVEIKAGYNGNDLEFIGMQVGGSTATAAQGVYAVLPFEVGLAYFPLTAPTFNLKIRGPKGTYLKTAAQRSLDPKGGVEELARNHTGFRFIPHGDQLLSVNEIGFRREASSVAPSAWLRAGYLYNTTKYMSLVTGAPQSGNYSAYVLMDYQVRKTNSRDPGHGLYVGGSAMTAPSQFNPYDRYYEARLYQEAPFRSRPYDLISVIASHTGYSDHVTDSLVAQGKSVWRSSSTLTGSYALRAARGNYVGLGLSYIYGPAITPRVSNAMNFGASWTTFF
jgi:porin